MGNLPIRIDNITHLYPLMIIGLLELPILSIPYINVYVIWNRFFNRNLYSLLGIYKHFLSMINWGFYIFCYQLHQDKSYIYGCSLGFIGFIGSIGSIVRVSTHPLTILGIAFGFSVRFLISYTQYFLHPIITSPIIILIIIIGKFVLTQSIVWWNRVQY